MSDIGDGYREKLETASVERAFGLLEGKWKCLILLELLERTHRFNELRRRLPTIGQKTLTSHLRDLERDGLVERAVYTQVPIRVEYRISAFGKTLEPILLALRRWAGSHGQELCRKPTAQEPDEQMTMWA